MKKISLFLICTSLFLLPATANAQLYMRIGTGYATALAGQSAGNMLYNGSHIDNTIYGSNGMTVNYRSPEYHIKAASFAAGLQGYLGLGYNFSRHVALQLDANVGVINKKYVFTSESNGYRFTIARRAQHNIFLLPALVVQTGNEAANFYARMGLVIPLRTKIKEDEASTATIEELSLRLSNYFSLGAAGAFGIQHKCGGDINIWAEASFQSLSLFAKREDVIAGQAVNSNTLKPTTAINYSKNSDNSAEPMSFDVPFSSAGISAGISFRLSHAHKAAIINENK